MSDPRTELVDHVPRDLLPGLFARVHAWLRPGGLFLATLGASDIENWKASGSACRCTSPATSPSRTGSSLPLELVADEVVSITEPEGAVSFHWVLARR